MDARISTNVDKYNTKSQGDSTFNHLPNPYSLTLMQSICDSVGINVDLDPTNYYVKFIIKDSSEIDILSSIPGLELFDYPLDIDLAEGEQYNEAQLPSTDIAWLYSSVSSDFEFPEDIDYVILEECYIPGEEDNFIGTRSGIFFDLEREAYYRLGYLGNSGSGTISPLSIRERRPSGRISFETGPSGVEKPVKGVKVRCHTFVKVGTSYTDEDGYYSMDKTFKFSPTYGLFFENSKDFKIWGIDSFLACANHNMGCHSNNGYSICIGSSSYIWEWIVVNNAAYDYYEMCASTGISFPPERLKLLVLKNFESSSAPMLNHLSGYIGYTSQHSLLNGFINIIYGSLASFIMNVFSFVLPDITIGTDSKTYDEIMKSTFHELSHSSHYSKVGDDFWTDYVSYIMTYGAYGDESCYNHELCGVGESWGHFMGPWLLQESKFHSHTSFCPVVLAEEWIHPELFWNLCYDGILSPEQIFSCLSSDVRDYSSLISSLCAEYPTKTDEILSEANRVGIDNNTVTVLSDCTISQDSTVVADGIVARNIIVNNGAKLTLLMNDYAILNSSFCVNLGSSLEISRQ